MVQTATFPTIPEQQVIYDELKAAVSLALALYDLAVDFPRPKDTGSSVEADWREHRVIFRHLSQQLLIQFRQHSFDVRDR